MITVMLSLILLNDTLLHLILLNGMFQNVVLLTVIFENAVAPMTYDASAEPRSVK
jgi:hypothetical protein